MTAGTPGATTVDVWVAPLDVRSQVLAVLRDWD